MASSQLAWLKHDIDLFNGLLSRNQELFAAVGNHDDLTVQNHAMVLADLFYRAIDCASGLGRVLADRGRVPTLVLSRALLEASLNVKYIQSLPDPAHGSLVLRAFSLLKWIEIFDDDPKAVAEWKSILARMPEAAVDEATHRCAGIRGWTGKSVKDLCEIAGFKPYSVYKHLSIESHGGIVGRHAVVIRESESSDSLTMGSSLDDLEVESTANFGRRMLHATFKAAWDGIGGPKVDLKTANPDEWVGAARA